MAPRITADDVVAHRKTQRSRGGRKEEKREREGEAQRGFSLRVYVRTRACTHARTHACTPVRAAEGKPGEDAEREKRSTTREKEGERKTRLDLGRRDAREANTAGIGIFSVVDRTVH